MKYMKYDPPRTETELDNRMRAYLAEVATPEHAALARARNKQRQAAETQTVREAVQAITDGDCARLTALLGKLEFLWKDVFRRLVRIAPAVGPDMRAVFLRIWIRWGDSMRDRVGDDLLLVRALRLLLPAYDGPGLTLYRGESAANRRWRNYGLAWSREQGVGDGYARGIWQTFEGGSVLLKTMAEPQAIICAPMLHDNGYGEDEYLVDRRFLGTVTVLARYSQRPY
jgi:hypothetical protein